MASLWIRSGIGWPERDFGATIQLCQVGARFEALDELVFMAPSEFFGIFLQPKRCHLNIVDPEAGQKGILELSYSYVKWGLISKLLVSSFSWRPQNSLAFFYNPNDAI